MKELLKRCAYLLSVFLVLPLLIPFRLKALLKGRDDALCEITELLALLPGQEGRYLRNAFLRLTVEHCDPSARIGFGTTFSKAGVRINGGVYIGSFCSIGLATIGNDALLASGTYVTSGSHQHGIEDVTRPIAEQSGTDERVAIGEGCWIGSHTTIMADVGKGAVVAAGAVVSKPVPDFTIVGGVPARVLKSRMPSQSPSA